MIRSLLTLHRLRYSLLAFCGAGFSLFSVLSVSIVMPFVNLIFGEGLPSWIMSWSPADPRTLVLPLCIATWFLFLVKNAFFLKMGRIAADLKTLLLESARTRLLQSALARSLADFQATRDSGIVYNAYLASERWVDLWIEWLTNLVKHLPLVTGYLCVMVAISWELTLLSFAVVPLTSLAYHVSRKQRAVMVGRYHSASARLLGEIHSLVQSIPWIKTMRSESHHIDRFRKVHRTASEARSGLQRTEGSGVVIAEMAGVTAGVILLWVIGIQTLEGHFKFGPGGLVLFIAAVFSLIDPIKHLARSRMLHQECRILWDQLPKERTSKGIALIDKPSFTETITVDHISFRHEGALNELFSAMDLEIKKGDKIAIMGPSGSGKSTLIDLLCGLYDPVKGAILIDGLPISAIAPQDVAKTIGVIRQETYLFPDTIRYNIAYDRILSDELITNALKSVQMEEWLRQLPAGLDTMIGDQGETLSGGERQRLAMARLIVRNPEILILDEATSALDIQTEAALYETLFEDFSDRTILVISHRDTVLPWVDRVLTITDGKLMESVIVGDTL